VSKSVRKKRFCKLSRKDIEGDVETFAKLVSKPAYFCEKCCRVSTNKQNLCRPKKLKA
jgi:hypothetical protein